MKRLLRYLILISIIFTAAALVVFSFIRRFYERENGMRNVVVNRIVRDLEQQNGGRGDPDLTRYRQLFDARYVPDRVECLTIEQLMTEEADGENRDTYASSFLCPVRDGDGVQRAVLRITYFSGEKEFTVRVAGGILLGSWLVVLLVVIAGYRLMIQPFDRLSEYPEKIAQGRLTEGIPQSRSMFFRRYIWGMNMLKDELGRKEKNIREVEKEKQTMIVSIAHGIKTPLSNIRLYAEAIERGIYREEKRPDEADSQTAEKILKNVEKVDGLVKEILESSKQPEVREEENITTFYLEELLEMIRKDYAGRMELLHIPFETVCENNPLITSDRDGIYRIAAQLLDNAIKYGDGRKIRLVMGRQDEDFYLSVKNKGKVLSEEECAYVFQSYWRGSNASDTEGQGIGLYVAKKTAERLGGDLFMKSWKAEEETEVTLILPL